MITQRKIEQAAKEYAIAMKSDLKSQVMTRTDFTAGVRFAEAEMKPKISEDVRQRLFNYFAEQHGVQLLESDFLEIENYIKPEMKQDAQEFAEWCAENAYSSYESNQINWTIPDGKWCIADQPNVIPKFSTTSELYTKFDEERGRG